MQRSLCVVQLYFKREIWFRKVIFRNLEFRNINGCVLYYFGYNYFCVLILENLSGEFDVEYELM